MTWLLKDDYYYAEKPTVMIEGAVMPVLDGRLLEKSILSDEDFKSASDKVMAQVLYAYHLGLSKAPS